MNELPLTKTDKALMLFVATSVSAMFVGTMFDWIIDYAMALNWTVVYILSWLYIFLPTVLILYIQTTVAQGFERWAWWIGMPLGMLLGVGGLWLMY